MSKMLTMKAISERLGIPYSTVRWMRASGKLPEPDQVVSPQVILWTEETIDKYEAELERKEATEVEEVNTPANPFEGKAMEATHVTTHLPVPNDPEWEFPRHRR